MLLQSSKEHKVNGMTSTAICSPLTPTLSLKGEGVLRAGIILWGTLSPPGEEDILSQFLRFCLSFLDTYPDNYYLDDVFREVPP